MITKRKNIILLASVLFVFWLFAGCRSVSEKNGSSPEQSFVLGTSSAQQESSEGISLPAEGEKESEKSTEMKIKVQVENHTFTATLECNAAARAFLEKIRQAPVVIQMQDYSGFEKVGSLGANLPTDNSQITTQEGDIVLYNGNQIVIFYGSNSWSYTRLGKIDDVSGWKDALGNGDVTVIFSEE